MQRSRVGRGDGTANDTPVPSASPEETTKQPTYTTVGSIYNPGAATPLQPPTRRPRTRRHPHILESPSGDVFAFPNSALTAFAWKEKTGTSPTATGAVLQQHYTPLRQNYDRAVSPIGEQERSVLSGTGMAVPSIRSGNLPPPSGLEDNDSVASEDTLASSRITVKGLTNLASYPNPMQKAAQKALARARPANRTFSRPETLSPLSFPTPDRGKDRAVAGYVSSTAAPGPPEPLTAGPPGSRLKTFTLGTLGTMSTEERNEGLVRAPPPPLHYHPGSTHQASTVPTASHGALQRNVSLEERCRKYGPISRNPVDLSDAMKPRPGATSPPGEEARRPPMSETPRPEQITEYFPHGLPTNYNYSYKSVMDDWLVKQVFADVEQHNQPPLPETPAEKVSRLDRAFYAGTRGFTKDVDQAIRDDKYQRLESKVGVIGGERERLRESLPGKLGLDTRAQMPKWTVEEACQTERSEHAKPLLHLAFTSLWNMKEAKALEPSQKGWAPHYVKPDMEWVDNSAEGQKSFFESPKVEHQHKKKKTIKSTRRLGY
ncbi:hypothetical protein QBC35DRAFT_153491 [Podospora australis]|uniref:Uncharacterized protein n=1 Tax=Podospora australis TaxID=1536484 RepID=A0AAN6WVL7_9PEZI|nr:hypothetical protein QBC35DRAFT_153491 [Podospora australis]